DRYPQGAGSQGRAFVRVVVAGIPRADRGSLCDRHAAGLVGYGSMAKRIRLSGADRGRDLCRVRRGGLAYGAGDGELSDLEGGECESGSRFAEGIEFLILCDAE